MNGVKLMKHTQLISIAVVGGILAGCQTTDTGTKEQLGTLLGAVGGAVLGSQFGDGAGQLVAVAVGTGVGAYIGSEIGKSLDEADRLALAKSTENAFTSGESQSWSNPESGVSATVAVKETTTETKPMKVVVLKDKVQEVPPMEFIGESYQSVKRTNVRGGPGTKYVVVDSLGESEVVNVVGKVNDAPWYMISKGGAGSGFVHADLLMRASDAAPIPQAAPVGEVTETEVAAAQTCRVATQTVTMKDGTTASEEVKACKGPNGWEII